MLNVRILCRGHDGSPPQRRPSGRAAFRRDRKRARFSCESVGALIATKVGIESEGTKKENERDGERATERDMKLVEGFKKLL